MKQRKDCDLSADSDGCRMCCGHLDSGRKAGTRQMEQSHTDPGTLEVHFLDAGQGDSILVSRKERIC